MIVLTNSHIFLFLALTRGDRHLHDLTDLVSILIILLLATQKDKQCTYNVPIRRVHETIIAVKRQYYLLLYAQARACVRVIVLLGAGACILTYSACKEHAPYCDCGFRVSDKFFGLVTKTARFTGKKVTEQKMCFDFLCNFYLKHFSF
jgi:hypothetical protein